MPKPQLRDRRYFRDYISTYFNSPICLPKYPKSSCLIIAAVHDNVEKLKVLLDSPEWYGVTDRTGETLLHIAVTRNSVGVFNYLLSLVDYPLNAINDDEDTALVNCIRGRHRENNGNFEYFLKTLVRRGVGLNLRDWYITSNHCYVISTVFFNTDTFMMMEVLAMLLYYRADLSITDAFKRYVKQSLYFPEIWINRNNFFVEHLLNLIFDQLESYDIDFDVLILLAVRNCPLFYKVYDCVENVHVHNIHYCESYKIYFEGYAGLFQMDLKYLKLLIEKFEDAISQVLLTSDCLYLEIALVRLENVEFLLESNLRSETLEAITGRYPTQSLRYIVLYDYEQMEKEMLTEKLCFLSSYGMKISSRELNFVHAHFPNSELFKILLHMDIQINDDESPKLARLYYDIGTDIESFRLPFDLTSSETDLLLGLGLYVHQKIKDQCSYYDNEMVNRKMKNLPQMPSLLERARNVFRKYFIEKMKITSAKQFYTMINSLQIGNFYKDIITYQRKIY